MNIRDIARLAGVSVSTVSKVMNGKDKDIGEETKKRVLKIIEEEHYVPYFKFREKEGLKSHLIGLILKRSNRERENIVFGAEQEARRQGYGLIVSYVDEEEEIEEIVDGMIKKKTEGLLIDSGKRIPGGALENAIVYLNQTQKFDERQKAVFYYRLSEAGRLAVERLVEAGHQKIACIIRLNDKSILDGYRLAMQRNNLQCSKVWTYEGNSIEDIEKYGIPQCLSEDVTAVVCGSQEIACCVCKWMERSRTVIPDELSVITIGDGRLLEILGCGITAVKLPGENMSCDAAGYLIHMLQEEKQAEVMRKFSPVLKERNSIVHPPQEKQGGKIIVVGSLNMDVTIEVSRIPVNGETQLAKKVYVFPGGKGGNQAVGVGKLGGQVYMIGCLGNDMDGKQLYSSLMENHVHMDGVLLDRLLPSGKAYINVDEKGESAIVVYPGANRKLSVTQINRCKYLFQNAKYCLLSLEIPSEIAEYTIKLCKRNHTEVILKPSASDKIREDLLKDIAYFVPNEKELDTFVPGDKSLEEKAGILREKGIETVIVTRGSRGCYLRNRELSMYFEGTGFEPVDTTGGADSFISALAVYLSEGRDIVQSIGFAIYASGISVTRYGVQPALPDRKAVDIYKEEIHFRYSDGEKGSK
ncbi:PfkB family carbohydrate kinase [Clostridium porci]|uniref:PfkB family carbohydrate kinase n=1 Tax=Clostridium porci TaxID=2605778 RepID=UPI003A90798C